MEGEELSGVEKNGAATVSRRSTEFDLDPAISGRSSAYFDEEDLLGYKIWVAELELLVGQKTKGKVDFRACYILLQKLNATIEKTSVEELKEYQRRCEDALVDILLKGAPPPVRRLICSSLSKMYGKGDQLPLFSRVSSLQLFLGTREAFGSQTSEDIRLGAMELMTELYYSHGRSLAVGVLETCLIAVKYCSRSCLNSTRQAGLRLLSATIEGVGYQHREADRVQSEGLKCIEKIMKEKNRGDPVSLGVSDVLRAIAACVPVELWLSGSLSHDTARALCLSGIRDPSSAVRYSFSVALGQLVASAHSGDDESAKEIVSHKNSTMEQCLIAPLAEALLSEDRHASIALSQAWVYFLRHIKMQDDIDDSALLQLSKGPLVSVRVASATSSSLNIEKGPIGPDVGLGASLSTGERPFSQACAMYILRCGIIEQLGEFGQREMLLNLVDALLHSIKDFPPSLIIVELECMSYLMEVLGEIGDETSESVEKLLATCLSHDSAVVRCRGGSTLASLAIAEPGRAARLFGSSLNALKNAADALVDISSSVSDKSRTQQGTPRWAGSSKFGKEIHALHGWSCAVTCLVGAVPSLPLGIPSQYLKVTSQIAAALIESPRCDHPGARCAELESGYMILGALSKHALPQFAAVYCDPILNIWLPVFDESSMKDFQSVLDTKDEQASSAEMWWRAEALHALSSYISSNLEFFGAAEKHTLYGWLTGMVKVVLDNHVICQSTMNTSRSGFSQLQACASLFQTRLFKILSLMPSDFWGDETLSALCNNCVEGIANSANSVLSVSGLKHFLTFLLDNDDDLIQRFFFSKDIFERDLMRFSGASGGLEREIISLQVSPASAGEPSFFQSVSLPEALLIARVVIISCVLMHSSEDERSNIVKRLVDLPSMIKKDKTGSKKLALAMVAASPLILGFGTSEKATSLPMECIQKIENMAENLVSESSKGFWVQITASNLYSAVSNLIDIQHSYQLLSALCKSAVSTPSLDQRATYVLSIGSISRAIGGLGLASLLPQIVQTLHALAKASASSISALIAHALTVASSSSGPAFLPYVKKTLDIAQEMILDDSIYSTAGLLPSIGRLGNAMVACLGPDYVPGSDAYAICRSIVSELRAPDSSGVRLKEDILSGALESVHYVQMLVLFVPNALTTAQHVTVLVGTLPSRQPNLRRAAADTIRHLTEKETKDVLQQNIQSSLFAALDGETDLSTTRQLKQTIEVLLENGAANSPSDWIRLLGGISTAAIPKKHEDSSKDIFGIDDDADTPEIEVPNESKDASVLRPRLKTRIFAADLLSRIPRLASQSSKIHLDAIEAERHPGDWLVLSGAALVDIGFKLASGDVDGLRSRGVQLLVETLEALGSSRDPLSPEDLLMVQFQAQFVSALRLSLSKGASPAVNAAGCSLVALFLEKGISSGDNTLMEKILGLLCEPLSLWSSGSPDQTQSAYSEWVAAGARVALLESHAICATLQEGSESSQGSRYSEIVTRSHGPFYTILVECWTGLLEDTIVLLKEEPVYHASYTLSLYGRLGSSKAPTLKDAKRGIEEPMRKAWPRILDAATLVMAQDRTVSHGDSGKSRYCSLFELAVACSTFDTSFGHAKVSILRSFARLTKPQYAAQGWVEDIMIDEAALVALEIMKDYRSSGGEMIEICSLGNEVIRNIVEISARKRVPGGLESRFCWVIECIHLSAASASSCLEKSLEIPRKALEILVSRAVAPEEVCYCLYHSLKCATTLLSGSPPERITSLAYRHIAETARIVSGEKTDTLDKAMAIDLNVPSISEILTCAFSELTLKFMEACDQNESVEHLLHVLLFLGQVVSHQGSKTEARIPECQVTFLGCLQATMPTSHANLRQTMVAGIDMWIEENPPATPWVLQCCSVIYPAIIGDLFEYATSDGTTAFNPEHIQVVIQICTGICTVRGESYLPSFLPILVRIASQGEDKKVTTAAVAALLHIAQGPLSSSFKSLMLHLPEDERLSLHKVLTSGSSARHERKSSGTTTGNSASGPMLKGFQALDLSRFKT